MDLKIEYVDIDKLQPYEHNTRRHGKEDVAKIAQSIERYGFNDPVGVWGEANIIVEGHGRVEAAKGLGIKTVPVLRLDHLTDEQRREYAIAHNRTAEFSEWDFEELEKEMADLDFEDFDLGFDFPEEDEGEAKEDEDFEVVVPEEPKTKSGQIYRLGRHRLMVGDSTKQEDVSKLCGGVQVDMLLTDPPYGVSYQSDGSASEARARHRNKNMMSIQNDNLQGEEFTTFLKDAFSAANAVMKAGASHLWASDRKQTTILEFNKPARNDVHPTMKPVPLFDYLMKNNTKGGDIVLDLFSGSGTTMVAAEQNGRVAYCMEFDPKYADVIIKRYIELVGSDAEVFLETEDGDKIPWSEIDV